MPKLSPIQWIIFVLFLAFYGFAVFALTRDYYLRNPSQVVPAAAGIGSAHELPKPQQQQRTWIQDAMEPDGQAISKTIAETDPLLLHRNADELFAQGRHGEAVPLYQRLIELDPEDMDAHNDLGLALHYSGRTGEGLDVLRSGTAKDSEHQRIWLSLGFVSAQSGDVAGAREALQKARDLDPDSDIGKEATRLLDLLQSQ